MPRVKKREAWGGRTSEWRDPLDGPMAEIAGSFERRVPRADVGAVEALAAAVGLARPRLTVVVVGSNGKTSTATYLSELFTAAGCRTGLFTSPHIAYWTERVRIDGEQVEGDALLAAVAEVSGLADGIEGLRFFDVLTLGAARLFADAGVEVAVYEAGIGGRSDATRALRPDVVVLTAIGLEHTQLLGETEEEILRHKLEVAPPGSIVVAGALGPELTAAAEAHSSVIGVDLVAEPSHPAAATDTPWYLAQNWELANAAARIGLNSIGCEPVDAGGPHEIYGRFTEVRRDGVEYLVDVAHNPQAWDAFLGELGKRLNGQRAVAVVSATRERPSDELAEAIASSGLFSAVYTTEPSVRPTHDTEALAEALRAAGQDAESRPDPSDALEAATASGTTVAIFGSTYIVTDAMLWLNEPPPQN
jgi:dihydrofolate synthase / folylpolyglutamate synthase